MSESKIREGYEGIYDEACKLNEQLEAEIRKVFAEKKGRIDCILKTCLEEVEVEEEAVEEVEDEVAEEEEV